MDERERSWFDKTLSMLARQRDEIRAAYVHIVRERGAADAKLLLEAVGLATVAAIAKGHEMRAGKKAPPAGEDDFG